jgi:hypothetical protein
MSRVEQPKLSEYPIAATDKIQVLDAYTIYKFMDPNGKSGRWQAVLKVKSTYIDNRTNETKTTVTVRVYRWQYRDVGKWDQTQNKRLPTGTLTWAKEHEFSVSKPDIWNSIKSKVDEYLASGVG